ncbi:TetR/AcrR family transcriptional regulator [Phenylobacterium kunshanense]|uniref:TetR/AcrR family transcriptional regulator n=1 Tax=Phenylobacterium kunshanense TaxID=1445034 RepID=A0A328BPI4_9CAUL|nr:TetR/AcrR family transcriptional regulator [Phenylobacterium kunshanense]RAK69003.1 TetR/AcrR family transcriptional regulator [Phenylobacterium kunshanense]
MKRGQHHGALREALIDASLQLLDTEGVEAVTIRAVARRAGVSHAAPINHFPDLRALLTAVATRCFEHLLGAARAARDARSDAYGRLEAFVDAYIDYALAHPGRYRMMWRMDILDPEDPALDGLVEGLYGDVEEMVAALPQPTRRIDPTTVVIALSSLVHGYASMRIDRNFIPASDAITGQPRQHVMLKVALGLPID